MVNDQRLDVEPFHDEPTRFTVSSRTRPGMVHLVDLDDEDGKPACSCEQFLCRGIRCHHIDAAQDFVREMR